MDLSKIMIHFLVICSFRSIQSFGILDYLGILSRNFHTFQNLIPQTKCIEGVGCFNNGPPWYQLFVRPWSAVPEEGDNIRYYLFTPRNPKNYYLLNDTTESIQASPFNSTLPTKLLLHGVAATFEVIQTRQFVQKDALLSVGDYNVIVVDYSKSAQLPIYQAVANIRVLGVRVGLMLKRIMNMTGVTAESMHCIGISLGTHACGSIGSNVPNFGRISAMSPSGPYFSHTDPAVRLDPSDALFVDTIMTAGGDLGAFQHYGHMNFLPDGGMQAPGCGRDPWIFNIVGIFLSNACAHNRAFDLYTESITSTNCTFKAVNCSGYGDFLENKCPPDTSTVAVMGFHAKPIPGIKPEDSLYLRTGREEPYCVPNSEIPPKVSDVDAVLWEEKKLYWANRVQRFIYLNFNLL